MWNMKCMIMPSNNLSHLNGSENFKENFWSHKRITFNKFITKEGYTWNITHNTGSAEVFNLKPERWGWLLDLDKELEGKAHDKRNNNTI